MILFNIEVLSKEKGFTEKPFAPPQFLAYTETFFLKLFLSPVTKFHWNKILKKNLSGETRHEPCPLGDPLTKPSVSCQLLASAKGDVWSLRVTNYTAYISNTIKVGTKTISCGGDRI